MKRSLRAASPGDEDHDFGPLPQPKATNNSRASLTTTLRDDDDYIVMTNPPETLPPHENSPNPLLEAATIVMWIVVALAAVYYVLGEQKRRRHRITRRRQERLEVFSPKKQANRRLELVNVLKATTMIVQEQDVVYCGEEEGGCEQQPRPLDPLTSADKLGSHPLEKGNHENMTSGNCSSTNEEEEPGEEENIEIQHLCLSSSSSLSSLEEEEQETAESSWTLRIQSQSTRLDVPATCVICMKRFRVKDQVTWSPNHNNTSGCCHAFHQHCIIEWLALLPDCNCPICRTPYCQLLPS